MTKIKAGKTVIAGSRGIGDYALLCAAIKEAKFKITEVVCGTAKGPDLLGKRWAEERGIPVREFPADWPLHGRSAGSIRNCAMAAYADSLVALWDGHSRGTRHMIEEARRRGLKLCVVNLAAERTEVSA